MIVKLSNGDVFCRGSVSGVSALFNPMDECATGFHMYGIGYQKTFYKDLVNIHGSWDAEVKKMTDLRQEIIDKLIAPVI